MISGFVIGVKSLFHPLRDHELYRDDYYWHLPDGVEESTDEKNFTDITHNVILEG